MVNACLFSWSLFCTVIYVEQFIIQFHPNPKTEHSKHAPHFFALALIGWSILYYRTH